MAATHLGKNSVGANQLKKNAVTSAKLKNNAVTAAKIKNGAITGAKVQTSTLGTVPSATNAGHASSADSAATATTATTATNFSRYTSSGLVRASVGQTVTVLTVGPFTVHGQCVDLGGGEYEERTFMTTTQAGSSETGYETTYNEADFDPGIEAELSYPTASTGPEWGETYGYYSAFNGWSADGQTMVNGQVVGAVHMNGSDCVFVGEATNQV